MEDFFDIIYAMHVEMGADPGRAPKHAGQKKTYKAVSESCNTPAASSRRRPGGGVSSCDGSSRPPPAGQGWFYRRHV